MTSIDGQQAIQPQAIKRTILQKSDVPGRNYEKGFGIAEIAPTWISPATAIPDGKRVSNPTRMMAPGGLGYRRRSGPEDDRLGAKGWIAAQNAFHRSLPNFPFSAAGSFS